MRRLFSNTLTDRFLASLGRNVWSLGLFLMMLIASLIVFLDPAGSSMLNLFGGQAPPPSQQMGQQPPQQPQQPPPSEQEQEMLRKQQRDYRKEQYEKTKQMAGDLLKMAQALKTSIDKAGENTLPLDAVKKTEEIESLAKKIRSRLKG